MVNPFKLNVIFYPISRTSPFPVLGVLGGIFFLFKFLKNIIYAKSGDPDQTPLSVVSGLGSYCSSLAHKKDA